MFTNLEYKYLITNLLLKKLKVMNFKKIIIIYKFK